MNIKTALALMFTFSGTSLWAAQAPTATDTPASLSQLLQRAEETKDLMPQSGAYAGQPVENLKGRTLKLLNPAQKATRKILVSATRGITS